MPKPSNTELKEEPHQHSATRLPISFRKFSHRLSAELQAIRGDPLTGLAKSTATRSLVGSEPPPQTSETCQYRKRGSRELECFRNRTRKMRRIGAKRDEQHQLRAESGGNSAETIHIYQKVYKVLQQSLYEVHRPNHFLLSSSCVSFSLTSKCFTQIQLP